MFEEQVNGETDAGHALTCLLNIIDKNGCEGIDPYDALNSPALQALTRPSKWLRIAAIQALKRFPVNIRPLLGINATVNPKALGLLLDSYVKLGKQSDADAVVNRLQVLASSLDAGSHGWGYPFDWQSRAFFVPRGTPNVVCSSFVGHALLDSYEAWRSEYCLQLAAPVGQFMLRYLNRIPEATGYCFSYTPLDTYSVHNANMLAVSFLLRLANMNGDAQLRNAALPALEYSLGCQNEDGSWFYSQKLGRRWVDSFHTGFMLEACGRIAVIEKKLPVMEPLLRGFEFYRTKMFLGNGAPKYYKDKLYPIDSHSVAEALCVLSSELTRDDDLLLKVLKWSLTHMRQGDGTFAFQKHRLYVNRISYVRWSLAWMLRGLTYSMKVWK